MNNLASGGEIDLNKTQDICKWWPCHIGESFKIGDCCGNINKNITTIKYSVHQNTFLSVPIKCELRFFTIPAYKMFGTNGGAIALN